jgi:hypothetical protein
MNTLIFAALIFAGHLSFAQKTSLTDIPTDTNTVISIKKGDDKTITEKNFEIVEGNGDVSGDPQLMNKEARSSWKKACDDWKKEIKDLNKSNEIIVLNCNKPNCEKSDGGQTVCESSGDYKVKVKTK